MKKSLLLATVAVLAMSAALWGQSITVNTPAVGEEWCQGTTHAINWTSSGVSGAVSIKLRQGGEGTPPILDIAASTANDGSFSWTVPASVAPGDYVVRVRTVSADPIIFGDSATFTVKNCTAPAAITVTAPGMGNEWARGTSKTITWTSSGVSGPLSIKLRDASATDAPPIMSIVDSTANDGSFSWDIPADLDAGNYKIRVRTVSNDPLVYDDSPSFSVTPFQTFIPLFEGIIVQRDLELMSVRYVYNRGGWIVARVKNHISAIDQDVSFHLVFPEMVRDGAQTLTRRITLAAGAEGDIYLYALNQNDIPFRGLLTRVTVDGPSSRITETNEGNNTREVRIGGLDISCETPHSDLELSKLYMQGGWDYRVKFKIRVRHNLARTINNVRVEWQLFDDGGFIRGTGDTWTIAALASGEEWVRQVDQKFGKHGRRNAHQPMLREGRNYRIVARIIDPENALPDIRPGNNSSSLTFHFD